MLIFLHNFKIEQTKWYLKYENLRNFTEILIFQNRIEIFPTESSIS